MFVGDTYITVPKNIQSKSVIEIVNEICVDQEPKPFLCEPEKLGQYPQNSGTTSNYPYAYSLTPIVYVGTASVSR